MAVRGVWEPEFTARVDRDKLTWDVDDFVQMALAEKNPNFMKHLPSTDPKA